MCGVSARGLVHVYYPSGSYTLGARNLVGPYRDTVMKYEKIQSGFSLLGNYTFQHVRFEKYPKNSERKFIREPSNEKIEGVSRA